MKDFEEKQRELFRSHLQTNIAEFSKTSESTMTILSTRKLTGRRDAQFITQSLSIARQPAWAAISVNLHNQLRQLVKETTAFLGTQHAVSVSIELASVVDEPVLGMTIPRWLASAELLEHQRVLRAMREALAFNNTPIEGFGKAAPYSLSNSSVAAATITSATAVINRVAVEIFKLADIKKFRLATSAPVKYHEAYERYYGVGEGPQAPMFIGDRSYPVPA